MSKSNLLFHSVSVSCRVLRSAQPVHSNCLHVAISKSNGNKVRTLSSLNSGRISHALSIHTDGHLPAYRESSSILSSQSKLHNSTTSFGQSDEIRRSFASRRKGGSKGKKGKQDSNVIANEELISRLIRDAGESSADKVPVRLVIDEGPDTPSSVEMITLSEAIVLSLDRELDLIGANINGDPPVIRATQLSKLEYKQQQAQKKQQQAASNKKERKSFRFKAGIESNDLERKLDRLKGFLDKGHECEFTVFTKLRTLRQNPNAGLELVDQIRDLLSDHGDMKRPPQTNETKSFYRVQYEPKR